ncbi:hypothetical protein [Actinoplanes sp. NPDC051859]|uniref:hypothetical protein n=1 Tax=Actinoplanes sp. NPDC051859 TaxID=3363909 RepID=UPI0037AD0D2D
MQKIRVRELALRLSIAHGTTVTVSEIVALGVAVGLPLHPATSLLNESHLRRLFAGIWGDELEEKIAQVMTADLPLSPPRNEIPVPSKPQGRLLRALPARPVSASAQAAARAARPGPPPIRPLPAIAVQAARGGTVRVDQLASMTRAMLPSELASRDRISRSQAERYADIGLRWAQAGFTDRSARRWRSYGINPEAACILAIRGVAPELMDREVPFENGPLGGQSVLAGSLITDLAIPAQQVYDLLVAAGHHAPVQRAELVLPSPSARTAVVSAVPQVMFSSPGADQVTDGPPTVSRRRNHAKRHQARHSTERR